MPKTIPVRIDMARAATTDTSGTSAGSGVVAATMTLMIAPSSIPTAPPMSVTVAASTRNCQRISRRLAPNALRTPISRVRSVTEIIMIATTPTPPTISPTLDNAIITRKNIPVTWFQLSSSLSCVTVAKLFSSPGRRPRIARMAPVTSSMASATLTFDAGETRKFIQPRQYRMYLTSVE